MMTIKSCLLLLLAVLLVSKQQQLCSAFSSLATTSRSSGSVVVTTRPTPSNLFSQKNDDVIMTTTTKASASTTPKNNNLPSTDDYLDQETQGGFTVKQRLREEVESPFRKVRLLFFGSSAGSALTALYFSLLSTIKAVQGGYADAPPLDEALTSDAINIGAAIICAFLAYREYEAGQANLQRIARGGALASLQLQLPNDGGRQKVGNYRRNARVLIAAGGKDYISKLCRSLTADQLADSNILPEKLQNTDVLVVPVLLTRGEGEASVVGNTLDFWNSVQPEQGDRNMDITRADDVIAFPVNQLSWSNYLKPEIETAAGQGFDVLATGITLTVKKNGRILRRATGLPPWGDLIATMEVMDGSRFGMPGDSERYGGP